MHDENTKIKDLTEIERLIIGSAVNLVYNLVNNQIYHIENHDPSLLESLSIDEKLQEDFILLQSLRDISLEISEVFGKTFENLSEEEIKSILKPGMKLEIFFQEIFDTISCGNDNQKYERNN